MNASHAFLARSLRLTVAVIGVSALLTGCGGDDRGPSEKQAKIYMKGLDGRESVLRPGVDANATYADGMALKAHGDCAAAIPKLRQVAGLGPGYEGAQTALGECLIQQASGSDPTSDYLEGLTWLMRAADSGWPEAQARLAYAYALGPTALRNTAEAAYWMALYRTNSGQARVGFVAMPADQLAAIAKALPPPAVAAGAARAEKWERKVWLPPNPPSPPGPEQKERRKHRDRD